MEINLIIPAAGKSSRFNSGKPKWMRTHPDGKLMIEHSIETFLVNSLKCNLYLIITEELEFNFKVTEYLKNTSLPLKEIIILNSQTHSPAETILKGFHQMSNFNLNLPTIIKDSDNFVDISINEDIFTENFTVGCDLNSFDVGKIKNKSFLILNDLNYVVDFVEKRVVSDTISVGTHCIKDMLTFINKIDNLVGKMPDTEIYLSHIIASLIYEGVNFKAIFAENYIDFGTQKDWNDIFKKHTTYFVDFDGTLVKNKGKYGSNNWFDKNDIIIPSNVDLISKLQKNGAEIIITTSRPEILHDYIREFLSSYNILPKAIICSLNHSPRIIINDFANTNPYPSCSAINLKRDSDLSDYFQYE